MTEAFLHYVWQYQYFDKTDLKLVSGEPLNILQPGMMNTNAGPDFEQARIRIAEVNWVGSVEIHINSEGWNEHMHEHDAAYENVILHVVWENKKNIFRKDGSLLPTLELKNRLNEKLYQEYLKIIRDPGDIPCEAQLHQVKAITRLAMLEKVTTERLEQKSELINKLYQQTNHDWEETAYQALAANFGFKVNKDPFLQLARVLPYKIIRKHADKLLQIEALLLGTAGLLPQNTNDEYLQVLNREYTMLSHKYGLHDKQLNPAQWRLLRLRPANFPAIRLMQFAALLKEMNPLFSALTDFDDAKTLLRKIRVKQSDYWRKHYLPAKPSEKILPALGATSAENIAINTVVPLLVLYGKLRDEQARIEKAVDLLQQLKAEDNRITRRWQGINWKVNNAFDSQALIALYNNYCLKRRCLQCNIGCNLLLP